LSTKQTVPDDVLPLDDRMIEEIGEDLSRHLLLPTLQKQRIQSFLCKPWTTQSNKKIIIVP
jgi:hypothetical protein